MNKISVLKIVASALAVLSMTTAVSAKGFTKTQEYKDGQFTDVPAKQWYAAEVKSAYELGFMNGKSDTAFDPDGNVTVAEGITMASRVHANYNGKTIAEMTGGKWYDMYIAYAVENGLIKEGQFANFDRNIMRYEMAVMFANAMPADYFVAKNDIKDIPDVASTEEYYDELMMLYKAGVVLGSDDYGNFYSTNPIKRSETAAIINRVALPENRKEGKLLEYGNRNPAVYLIRDDKIMRTVRSLRYIASGWLYEDQAINQKQTFDYSYNVLTDMSDKTFARITKEIETVTSGKLGFEALYNLRSNGLRVIFEDLEGNILFEIYHKEGTIFAIGDKEYKTDYSFKIGDIALRINFDMDNRNAEVIVDDVVLGKYNLSSAKDMSRVRISTGVKESASVSVQNVYLYWNYDVNDTFRFAKDGSKPFGWTVSDNVSIGTMASDVDSMSVKMSGQGSAERKFDKVSDKFVYETYVFVPKGQSMTVSLKNGNKTALSVDASDGQFTVGRTEAALSTGGNKLIRKYTDGIWQLVRAEVDTNAHTALIKINGKETLTVPYNEDGADGISVVTNGTGDAWFDDISVYNVFDYEDYCPTPVPVNDDGWYSGMSVCSLWQEGSHMGWDAISPYDELQPVIGYYDEGIPEVADWEIKFMVEHGYDYQRMCWYHGGRTPLKRPRLVDGALHDGYFNAKYSDMLDFSIMWENATSTVTKEQFLNDIWPYWKDWYITDDRYFCIDNKPVVTIYYYSTFRSGMGGKEGVKEVIDIMEKDCKELGYDGIVMYVSDSTADANLNKELAEVGFEAKVAYHFEEPSYDIEYQKIRMNAEFNADSITFTPSCGIGFNDIGWTETRSPLASADDFEKILRWARDEYLPKYTTRGISDWRTKSVFTTTWNEFGEGHYVFPSGFNGFGYMDAHRHVFSAVADKNDAKHFDVVPTDNQKSRLGYLYQARRIPMRKLLLEEDSAVEVGYEVVKGWDFSKKEDFDVWGTLANTTSAPEFDQVERAFKATTNTVDGHIKMLGYEENFFKADECTILHINMKIDKGGASIAELYFNNEKNDNYAQNRSVRFSVIADGEYHDYYIDLTKVTSWQGEIRAIRFDPINTVDTFYIRTIEFLAESKQNVLVFNVDGQEYEVGESQYEIDGNKLYVAANPSTGFYGANRFTYEWNRWNGNLVIRTGNGNSFEFNVDSDVALVNGNEKKLDRKVTVFDGLVVLPLSFIYENAGYGYTVNGKKVNVEIRMKGAQEIIASRIPNQFEFEIEGDTEGWTVNAASGTIADGCVKMEAIVNTSNRFDPQLQNSKLNAETIMYKEIEVRVRPVFASEDPSGRNITFYFATDLNNKLREAQTVRTDYAKHTPDAEGFYTIRFDMTQNEYWTGILKILRFDPADCGGIFEVDYIRLIPDPSYVEKLEQAQKEEAEYAANLKKADEGAPFYIRNADAEGSYGKEYSTGSTVVSLVEDELNPGNHVFHITTTAKQKSWCYFIVPTRFKPGVTYQVEFDYRLVGDMEGNEANDIPFSVNFRYTDYDKNGAIQEKMDHAKGPQPTNRASTKDGWKHCTITHTVSANSPTRSEDYFCIFTDPVERDGKIYNHQYMVDNFVVTVIE